MDFQNVPPNVLGVLRHCPGVLGGKGVRRAGSYPSSTLVDLLLSALGVPLPYEIPSEE